MSLPSDEIKKGITRAPQRSLLRALGLGDREMGLPFIGVANSFNEIIPGHTGLRQIADEVKAGIWAAGGVPGGSSMEDLSKQEKLKRIPAVGKILSSPQLDEISRSYPRNLTLKAVHRVLEALRKKVESEESIPDLSIFEMGRILEDVKTDLRALGSSRLRPVINATGVVIHTNLGRSILAESVIERFRPIAGEIGRAHV